MNFFPATGKDTDLHDWANLVENPEHTFVIIEALKLSDEIGVKKACEQLNVNYGKFPYYI